MDPELSFTVDCRHARARARFWCRALGYEPSPPPKGWATWEDWLRDQGVPEDEWDDGATIAPPAGRSGPRIAFLRVPEPKMAKNRLHHDVRVSAGRHVDATEREARIRAAVADLVAAGAQVVTEYPGPEGGGIIAGTLEGAMTSYADAFERVETWTEAEFLSLPEDGPRIELIDGSLVVSPTANRPHQEVVFRLQVVLDADAPAHLKVLSDINVRVGPVRLVRPDLVVLAEPGDDPGVLDAQHALLVGEVTSPSNAGIDRLLKPQLYASAGIPWYLRIELAGSPSGVPAAVLYRLVDGAYLEHVAAEADAQLALAEPYPVTIDLTALVGRRPR